MTDIFGDCEMLSLHRADFTRLLQPHYAKELQKRCALLERTFAFEVNAPRRSALADAAAVAASSALTAEWAFEGLCS